MTYTIKLLNSPPQPLVLKMKIRLRTILLLLLPLPLLPTPARSAEKPPLVYHLISDQPNADLDYPLLKRLQRQQATVAKELREETPDDKITAFQVGPDDIAPLVTKPVDGKARVLTFCALSIGRYADPSDGKTEFIYHHQLILKIDRKGRIVDGFYFPKEWAEPPMLRLMLRIKNHKLKLGKDLKLAESDFCTLAGNAPEYFKPGGWLDNRLNNKEAF